MGTVLRALDSEPARVPHYGHPGKTILSNSPVTAPPELWLELEQLGIVSHDDWGEYMSLVKKTKEQSSRTDHAV